VASEFKISTAARNAACDAIVDLIDAGAGGGRVEIRTGSPPANVGDASTGTLLATLTFGATAYGSASTGTAQENPITSDSSADASGDAGYFRIYHDGAGDTEAIMQGTCGEIADTPDLVFDDKSIVAGGQVAISDLPITMPIQ
jgi:hypothetical protein